ncbi:MAG: hypothetical protein PUC39_01955 [Lachnospiraceae bacterium]|nr:hypothetical protein [Lachnospiraceae bacterium]
MNQNWLNDQRLEQIGWDKRTFLLNWIKENSYKKKEDLIPAMMALNATMQKKNLSFTEEEQKIFNEIILDAMTPAERQKVQMLQQMLSQRR